MSDYNQYVTAVNKIFDYLSKMKVGWNNADNNNYIASIEEYKNVVSKSVDLFKNEAPPKEEKEQVEALGDD